MKKILAFLMSVLVCTVLLTALCPAYAANEESADSAAVTEEESADNSLSFKALAAGVGVGLAAAVGALAMGMAVSKATESMSRQPEAAGKINSAMMLGLVFIETAIIYALIVAILIIFVL